MNLDEKDSRQDPSADASEDDAGTSEYSKETQAKAISDALSRAGRTEKDLADREAKLAKEKKELEESAGVLKQTIEEAKKIAAEISINKKVDAIANQYRVDSSLLLKFTDGSPEAMEALAKELPKVKTGFGLSLDSGKTIATGNASLDALASKDTRTMSYQEQKEHKAEFEKAFKEALS